MKHTQGPWHVGMKPGPIIYSYRGEQVVDMINHAASMQKDENAVNARLIAAAPEMLAALWNIVYGGNVNKGTHYLVDAEDIDAAIAAIKKAGGE